MKKELTSKSAKTRGTKRKFFAKLFSLLLFVGNVFGAHHAHAADSGLHGLNSYSQPHKRSHATKRNDNNDQIIAPVDPALEKAHDLWAAAALLARPLLFEHEDCELFQGKKKVGNFGVFWPKRIELPTDGAFRRYVNSEKQKIAYIVERLGAGPEQNITLYQMAQIYSFVHNTTVASGDRALNALKNGGMKVAQAVMSRVDRVKGMKTPLRGLAERRKDEAKLGAGELDIPISRRQPNGTPHTLASLQAHYNQFVSRLGVSPAQDVNNEMPTTPAQNHARKAEELASDPI